LENDIFKATLKDFAFPWYYKQPHGTFPKWIILKNAILAQLRPWDLQIGFMNN
jgi:hypothetical protein